jgi:hypothetical protein
MGPPAPTADDAAGFVEGLDPFRRLQPSLFAFDRSRHPDDADRDVIADDHAAVSVSVDMAFNSFKLVHAAHPFNI